MFDLRDSAFYQKTVIVLKEDKDILRKLVVNVFPHNLRNDEKEYKGSVITNNFPITTSNPKTNNLSTVSRISRQIVDLATPQNFRSDGNPAAFAYHLLGAASSQADSLGKTACRPAR